MPVLNFLRMRYWPNMDLMDVGIRRENSWISGEVIAESRRRLEELKSDKKSVKEPDFLFHSWLDAGRDQKLSCLQDGKQEEQRRGDGKKGERWIRRGRDRDGRFTKVQREDKRWKWKACQVGQKREREMEDRRRRIIFLLVLFFLQAGGNTASSKMSINLLTQIIVNAPSLNVSFLVFLCYCELTWITWCLNGATYINLQSQKHLIIHSFFSVYAHNMLLYILCWHAAKYLIVLLPPVDQCSVKPLAGVCVCVDPGTQQRSTDRETAP